jgi:wyosine [tRNA(Phe)-imidazoG37] synthetase (radical SAM superfamily)
MISFNLNCSNCLYCHFSYFKTEMPETSGAPAGQVTGSIRQLIISSKRRQWYIKHIAISVSLRNNLWQEDYKMINWWCFLTCS